MRRALLFLLLSAALSGQSASVDGIVINRTTEQPTGGVHVRLITGDIFENGGVDHASGAISDKAGHFSITAIQPGLYLIVLERGGFVQARTADPAPFAMVALKAGQTLTGQKFEMIPRAAILGRVVDEYGDPVQPVAVEVRRVPPDRESAPLFSGPSRASTDERGEISILTSRGRYYVQAFPQTLESDAPPEIRSDGSVRATYNATYYPSAVEVTSAAVVQADPGEDVTGIEIHLRRAAPAGPVFTVSGLVTGVPDGARANVTLRVGDTSGWFYDSRSTVIDPGGKFAFTGLQPAFYSVIAQYSSGETRLQSQSVDFTLDNSVRPAGYVKSVRVGSAETEGLILDVRNGLAGPVSIVVSFNMCQVHGTVSDLSGPIAGAQVLLQPVDTSRSHAYIAKSAAGGAYTIADVTPGKYKLLLVDADGLVAYQRGVDVDDYGDIAASLDLQTGDKIAKDLRQRK